ncbi:hypothetical protein Leryth_001181 [Lithospermum erythrorhizon]|nr:hypothetical protein Leryth_001181 [Lithospermum erythrorhizon]
MITRQEGTLWWHSHSSYLRATIHGAIIIRPRYGRSYPFPKPYREVPIVFGEWWNANVVDVVDEATASGGIPNISNAFTINGQPGDMYPCSSNSTYKLNVRHGKRYLLRIVNAAMQSILFFKIANHNMTVVAVDASYVDPYCTDVVVVAPGQTTDLLLVADQRPGSYYMAARPYQGSKQIILNNSTTTGIILYENTPSSKPIMPTLPDTNDNSTANAFLSNLTSLMSAPFWTPVPEAVDERMFITIGVGLVQCGRKMNNASCVATFGQRFAANMNNVSFQAPTKLSMLEAFFNKVEGIYTTDFPLQPPLKFDYTNPNNSMDRSLLMTTKATKAIKVKYNAIVEIVFQDTSIGSVENHPMHLHGFDFHILAQGDGNYNPFKDHMKFNLINPQIRNTVAVPVGGWAVIRFRANNPGVWFIHCHVEVHLPWGLAGAIIVENGPTPSTSLPPPPFDLPKC